MHTNMNDKNIDELINKALQEEQALPEGLSRRLEEQIDAWAATEEKKTRSSTRRRTLYWLSGVAASILLCIGFSNTRYRLMLRIGFMTLIRIRKMPPSPPKRLCSCCRTISIKVSAG